MALSDLLVPAVSRLEALALTIGAHILLLRDDLAAAGTSLEVLAAGLAEGICLFHGGIAEWTRAGGFTLPV